MFGEIIKRIYQVTLAKALAALFSLFPLESPNQYIHFSKLLYEFIKTCQLKQKKPTKVCDTDILKVFSITKKKKLLNTYI